MNTSNNGDQKKNKKLQTININIVFVETIFLTCDVSMKEFKSVTWTHSTDILTYNNPHNLTKEAQMSQKTITID